ncbi:hypothetical protein HGA64_02350 [Candidatus Falkowbacteria bacterium]|nr:hypothetical protein [Candidatus Falkowbacteria bacterium]
MEYTKRFSELNKHSNLEAGGKGASLGEMINAGIPVPDGFVVITASFDHFLAANELDKIIADILHKVDIGNNKTVENASTKIRELIMSGNIPTLVKQEIVQQFSALDAKFVAVRSSATAEDGAQAAWAGQLESYLNTNTETLLENVKKCWASLFTPRAIFYRIEQGFKEKNVSVAVVVQKMVDSECAGIAFSLHPVLNDYRQIVIDAGYGLGESIVGGQVTPNSYAVDKPTLCILDKVHSLQERKLVRNAKGGNVWKETSQKERNRYVLSDDDIKRLALIILKIEKHYGFACDIEWAYEGGQFYIVQSRPVTTASNIKANKLEEENWYYWGCWKNTALWAAPWYQMTSTNVVRELGLENVISGRSIFTEGHYFTLQTDFDLARPDIIPSIEGKSDWLERYFTLCDRHAAKLLGLLRKKDLPTFLLELYEVSTLSLLSRYVDVNLEHYAKRLCEELGYSYQDLVSSMTLKKATPSSGYREAIANGVDSEIILEEFSWLGASFYTGQPTLTIEKIESDRREHKNVNLKPVKKSKLNKRLERCVEIGSEIAFIRTNLAELFSMVSYAYFPDLKLLADEYQISLTDIMKMLPEEVVKLCKTSKLPPDLPKRKSQFGIVADRGGINLIYDQELAILAEKFSYLYKPSASLDEFSGVSAFNGIVKGVARIVLEAKDIGCVGEGEIIVAPETTPDYILGMKKASAFVTNQGGITSHAAIVAREMQKPCVIATKIATEAIKDGDLVEVNANKGIVKILERKKNLIRQGLS